MKNQFVKTTIGLLAVLIMCVGASMAATTYRVTVDCNHSRIRNTFTGNRITVTFMDATSDVIESVSKDGIRNCAPGDAAFSITTDREVGYIDFRTNGNDAYYIDQWRLFKDGVLIHREERDNGMGWCLSTDPRDASGTWQAYTNGLCRTWIKFPVSGGTVPPATNKYKVTVDCRHARIRNTITRNRITVTFMDATSGVIESKTMNGITNCTKGDAAFSITTDREVGYIDFRTNGNDAYYIDQWRLFKNGALIHREERNNGMGWCLSTDPRDASGTWQAYTNGLCRTWIKFPV
ncbi:MAG: hypothetical protein OEQ28_09780 [Acidobacteriota bacterium]|nr:hypothetical protein [Acidobacteriota bacterium]